MIVSGEKGCFGEIEINLAGKEFDPELLTVHTTCYDNLTDLYIVDSFTYDGNGIDIDTDDLDVDQKSVEICIVKTGEHGGFGEMIYNSND